ncbi:MAG: bifunctional riboflavin kinase/FAD synthetase [Parachlamydiaceae bacterium]
MKIFSSYNETPSNSKSIVFTIGNFDAVHLGHCALLQQAKQRARDIQGKLLVLTFSNHPIEVLKLGNRIPKLCTLPHKLRLLEEQEVDETILFDFTITFAQQTADAFLSTLRDHFSFDRLILGHDARIGSDRLANSPFMQELAKKHHFVLEYIPPRMHQGQIISSSVIRHFIKHGDLATAKTMLGRSFSILTTVKHLSPTECVLNGIADLCLPPIGEYQVIVKAGGKVLEARLCLEENQSYLKFSITHPFDQEWVEVVFA